MLKRVQHDGAVVSGGGRTPSIFFAPSCLCARYIGAASGFGGAVCSRAMGEGPPLTQWSLSDQSGGLIPPLACGRGIMVWFHTFRHAELGSASYFLRVVGIKILKQVQDDG
jgi:hypothetical protein